MSVAAGNLGGHVPRHWIGFHCHRSPLRPATSGTLLAALWSLSTLSASHLPMALVSWLGASVSALAGSDGRVELTEHIATTGAFTDRTRARTSCHSVSIVVIAQYASERVAVTGHRSSHPKGVLCVCMSLLRPCRHPSHPPQCVGVLGVLIRLTVRHLGTSEPVA